MPLPIKNYAINIDRLEVMLLQNTSSIDLASLTRHNAESYYTRSGIVLERLKQSTKSSYLLHYAVTINKQRYGTLYLDNINNYTNTLIKFSLTNRTCYTDWLPSFRRFLAAFNCEINNITYVEIALDTNDDVLSNFLHYYHNTTDYVLTSGLRVVDGVGKYGKLYRNGTETPTYYLGKTSKQLALYNKSLEILESGKAYISDYHKANGLDTTTDVYRMELRLTNAAFKRSDTVYKPKFGGGDPLTPYQYEKRSNKDKRNYIKYTNTTTLGLTVDDLTNSGKLSELFELLLPSVLQFRKHNGTKNVSRLERVVFVEFNNTHEVNYITTTAMTKNRDSNMNKNAIRQTIKLYVATKDEAVRQTAKKMAVANNLQSYYDEQLIKFNIIEHAQKVVPLTYSLF